MTLSACRLPLLPSLPRPVNTGPVLFAVHLNLGWSELRVHYVFDPPPDVPLGFGEFPQSKTLLVNLKLDFRCTKPLPPSQARID